MSKSDDRQLTARTVLEDCRAAYEELKQTDDRVVYRRRWFAFIALLGAVDEIANVVDKNRLTEYKNAFDNNWRRDEPIYEHFIDKIRNQTVHRYKSGLFRRCDDSTAFETSAMSDLGTGMSSKFMAIRIKDNGPPITYVFRSGHYQGRDVYEICDKALEFLEDYLTKVEGDIESN
jgi:hypothetical protein